HPVSRPQVQDARLTDLYVVERAGRAEAEHGITFVPRPRDSVGRGCNADERVAVAVVIAGFEVPSAVIVELVNASLEEDAVRRHLHLLPRRLVGREHRT